MQVSSGFTTLGTYKCAKREVKAILIPKNKNGYFISTNYCKTEQTKCPRKEGEGYTKCKTICKQSGHAEINVLKEAGLHAKNSTIIITGHDHCCEECIKAMTRAGVSEVVIL